jgi:hypothetical protein
MDNVIIGMITPSSHYFRCLYSVYMLLLLSTLINYIMWYYFLLWLRVDIWKAIKLQSHMSRTLFVFLIAKVGEKWNIITRLRTVYFSSWKRHTYDLQYIMILSSLKGYRKQNKTQIKQKRKTQKGHNYRSDNISF